MSRHVQRYPTYDLVQDSDGRYRRVTRDNPEVLRPTARERHTQSKIDDLARGLMDWPWDDTEQGDG